MDVITVAARGSIVQYVFMFIVTMSIYVGIILFHENLKKQSVPNFETSDLKERIKLVGYARTYFPIVAVIIILILLY